MESVTVYIAQCVKDGKTLPDEWEHKIGYAVGGLQAVGFYRNSEKLLVVSSRGQSVIDCETGERIHRDRDNDGYDPDQLLAHATNDESLELVNMSGMDGGNLRFGNQSGWSLEWIPANWPKGYLVLNRPGSSVYMTSYGKIPDSYILYEDYAPLAWGFSWSGRTFISACSSDVDIWTLKE